MSADVGLRLELNQPGDQVRACFTPKTGRLPPDRAALEASLAEHGWQGARLDQAAVTRFLTQCQLTDREIDAVIGSVLDGAFELEITADKLRLLLTLIRPEGGRTIEESDIATAATSMGVVALLDSAAIRVALEAGSCEGREIVRGVAPVQGETARFDSLVQQRPARAENEGERVDLRDLGSLLLVNPGTALMRRTPARPGKDGMDILGKPIAAEPVVDTPYAADLTGVASDPNDPNLLLAVIAGSPRVLPNGVSVSPVVDVDAVDLHSGNVNFDGSLRVSGDIRTGMSVRVTGDVVVQGTIEAAHVEAGGDVIVKGGIIGKADSAHGGDPKEVASVRTKGAVHARYIQNAIVEAATEVVVESGIRQSDVSAGERVVVGTPTAQGSISGGRTRALQMVSVATLGAPAGSATAVQVGLNPFADQQRAELETRRRKVLEDQAKLQQLVAFFAKNPERAQGDVREKARATMYKINRDLFELDAEIAKLAEQIKPSGDAMIAVGRRIHGGVTLQVGHKVLKVLEDKTGGQVRVIDDRITVT